MKEIVKQIVNSGKAGELEIVVKPSHTLIYFNLFGEKHLEAEYYKVSDFIKYTFLDSSIGNCTEILEEVQNTIISFSNLFLKLDVQKEIEQTENEIKNLTKKLEELKNERV